MVRLHTTMMLIEGGRPGNVEELRQLSRRGISMLENLAVIASEDELCRETNGKRVDIEDVTFWRRITELFGGLFGHAD